MPRPLEPGDPRALGRFELLARLGEGGGEQNTATLSKK